MKIKADGGWRPFERVQEVDRDAKKKKQPATSAQRNTEAMGNTIRKKTNGSRGVTTRARGEGVRIETDISVNSAAFRSSKGLKRW